MLCLDCNNASFNYGYMVIVEPFAALSLLTFLRQYPLLKYHHELLQAASLRA